MKTVIWLIGLAILLKVIPEFFGILLFGIIVYVAWYVWYHGTPVFVTNLK